MNSIRFVGSFICFVAVCFTCRGLQAQVTDKTTGSPSARVVKEAVSAAEAFLKTLTQPQYEQVMYAFTDDRQRENWSNLPVGNVPRGGVRWGDMNAKQQGAAMRLLGKLLSEYGVKQVVDNMNGDEFLRINGRGGNSFGSDEYYISFLGEPSTKDGWMLQFGGHHLAINVTVVGEQMTMSPSLTGGQPIDYQWEGKQIRQVAEEEDAAYELIGSLTEQQLKKAVTAKRYGDINFGPTARSIKPAKEGIQVSEFSEVQQDLLKKLIGFRLAVLNPVHAKLEMEKVVSSFPETWFSWKGPVESGGDASFRIQGPKILMEYSPQRLGGVPTNHIHAMYRDPSNDYGVGFIDARRKRRQ